MTRKDPIPPLREDTASPEALQAVREHTAGGQRMTNMKWTMLHNVPLFKAMNHLMDTADRQLRERIPRRSMIAFVYAIARGNDCAVCGGVLGKLAEELGVADPESADLTEEERDLIAFARALTADANHIPDEIYERLRCRYDEETLVVLVMNAVFSMASNFFNNITGVEPEG